jgi:hypothetical protein
LKYKINYIFYWKVKLERKINFTREHKKTTEWGSMRIKTEIRNTNNFLIKEQEWKEKSIQ